VCPIVDDNYALVTETITPTSIYWIVNGGAEVDLLAAGATMEYSANLGGQKLTIPAAAITGTGRYCLCIQGTGIQNYNLDGLIVLPAIAAPTTSEIVTAIDSDIIEGSFTRIQIERIIAAVLAGTRANADNVDTFTGLDGSTSRLVASVSSTGRTISTRDGD
jgi:hypothetical protein